MSRLIHSCDECGTDFTIEFDKETSETDPTFCPFCSSYILDADDEYEED